MSGTTPSCPPEFKREALLLVRSSPNRTVTQVAKELGVSDNSLRKWVEQTEIDQGASQRGEGSPPGAGDPPKSLAKAYWASSPGKTGYGECLQTRRCGEDHLHRLNAMQRAWSLKKLLLRWEKWTALQVD